MEVTQFTYFQQVGGIEVDPVPVEITYGLERIAMYAQGVDSVYDLVWSYLPDGTPMTYGDVFHENERGVLHVQLRGRRRRHDASASSTSTRQSATPASSASFRFRPMTAS